jgi:hypothetical protein
VPESKGGKALRLLKSDWPRSLEELETMTASRREGGGKTGNSDFYLLSPDFLRAFLKPTRH